MGKRIFVTGNGTDVGKTLVCAALCQALDADYWKPVQAGSLENTDSHVVASLVSDPDFVAHPEAYALKGFMSPHAASELEGYTIDLSSIVVPQSVRPLVIEGAGGVLSPLSRKKLVADLIVELQAGVVFVSHNYLGSINHTLLSLEALKLREIDILGIVFNGARTPSSEEMILGYSGLRYLGHLEQLSEFKRDSLRQAATGLNLGALNEYLGAR